METILIAGTHRTTTRLGFGCAHLVGAVPWRQSSRLLDCAFDHGIRHFDVAPMYGFSEAESCLGDFVRRRRGRVSITTKFGIVPAGGRRFRRIRRLLDRYISPFGRRIQNSSSSHRPVDKCYDVRAAAVSLDRSLKRLRTEHIDVLLLHEATAGELTDDKLLHFLQGAVKSGRVGSFGVGGDPANVSDLLRMRRHYCPVIQTRWSLVESTPSLHDSFPMYYGIFGRPVLDFLAELKRDTVRCRRWSDEVGVDLSDASNLSKLIVRASLLATRGSLLLIASKRPDRIAANCAAATDAASDDFAIRFYSLIRESGLPN